MKKSEIIELLFAYTLITIGFLALVYGMAQFYSEMRDVIMSL